MFWKCFQIFQVLILVEYVENIVENRVITTLKYSKHYVSPTIINGVPATFGQVPYLVSIKEMLYRKDNNGVWNNLCGGTIIGVTRVLTAAHCFEHRNFYLAHHLNLLRVVAGSLANEIIHTGNDTDENYKQEQWRKVKKIVIHENFHFPTNDIALVIITRPFKLTDSIDYIPIASVNMNYDGICRAAGFGRIEKDSKASPVLRMGAMKVLSNSYCSKIWEMNMNNFVCTGNSMSDVAPGDSGSPLTCEGTKDPEEDYGKGILVGVVSGKNYDLTSIYTRVSAYRQWINTNGAGVTRECWLCPNASTRYLDRQLFPYERYTVPISSNLDQTQFNSSLYLTDS